MSLVCIDASALTLEGEKEYARIMDKAANPLRDIYSVNAPVKIIRPDREKGIENEICIELPKSELNYAGIIRDWMIKGIKRDKSLSRKRKKEMVGFLEMNGVITRRMSD